MNGSAALRAPPCLAVFDLDGTLTWHDTLVPYLAGYLTAKPARMARAARLLLPLLEYLAVRHDRGLLKSRLITALMGGDSRSAIEAWSERYVADLTRRRAFRPAALAVLEAHRSAGDRLVLLSASPDLYVPRIGTLLGFERTVCTEIAWRTGGADGQRLDGALRTPNRHGAEKSRCIGWLRAKYPGLPVVAYGNSRSDLPHLKEVDQALLVNGNAAARRSAAAAGIAVAEWI